jgi:mannose-1-phosphate guanylyltransferase/phosphomannomutase
MKAVIMAGGFGTRLRPLTVDLPKPMAPMVNKPMIERIIELLKRHHITELIILLYFQPETIKNYFQDGSRFGVKIKYIKAEADFGTAGAVRLGYESLRERFLVISGDVLTDFDLTEAISFHHGKKAKASIVLTHSKNPLQYGVVITKDDGKITQFLEKPTWGEVFSDTINTGIYIFEPDVLDKIPFKQEFDFSKNLFPLLLKEDVGLFGYIAEGYWRDVGNLNEYLEAHIDCLSGNVEIEIGGNKKDNTLFVGENANISDGFEHHGTVVIGKYCNIGKHVTIINSVIGDDCSIYAGATIKNSVLWSNVKVGMGSSISNDIIGNDCIIGQTAEIGDNIFIGPRCTIGNRSKLTPNIKLWPEKIVEDDAVLSTSLVWEDKWSKELFADSRISGLCNTEMNPEFCAKLGSAFGSFVGLGNSVVTSRDPDETSQMLKRAFTSGLMSSGIIVKNLQVAPSPIVRQALANGQFSAGIHVRRSPNNKNISDIIFFDSDGHDLPIGKIKSIEKIFSGEDFVRAPIDKIGRIGYLERIIERYREGFVKSIDINKILKNRLKVAIDYCNGIVSTIFPNILGMFNCQVISLNAYIDSSKFSRTREEIESGREEIASIMNSLKFDVGFMIDVGSERISILDDEGNFIDDDRLLSVVTKMYLMAHPETKKIAVPITASSEIDLIAKEFGTQVMRVKNSHYSMMQASLDKDVKFIGGTRGGFIFTDFFFAVDGIYAVSKIIELLASLNIKLSSINKSIPFLHMSYSPIFCSWESKGKIMRQIIKGSENQRRELIDGVKVFVDDTTWILIIPDKEKPLVHLWVESNLPEETEKLKNEYVAKLKLWQ